MALHTPYIDVCYRDDLNVAECLKKDMDKLIPKFKSGSEDFNLPPLDPMEFRDLVFDYNRSIVGGHLEMPDISINSLSTMKVKRISPQLNTPQKFILDFHGHVPWLNFRGFYNLTGNVFALPVNIDGVIDIVFEKVDMAYRIEGDIKSIGNHKYLDLQAFKFWFVEDGIKAAYITTTLSGETGNPTMNRLVITVLNGYWRVIMKNLLPVTFPVSDKLTRDHFKGFFKKYPFDILFPERKKISITLK